MDSLFVDVTTLPSGGYGIVQLLFLAAAYGYILFKASKLIADGAEMLLLVLPATLVGAVLLPVFGAVPDGAIVLFSGLGPDAQQQLSVGVGTLAGSTIMLLTIPWGACVALGRVDLAEDGKSALYKQKPHKLTKGWSMTRTGVQAASDVAFNSYLMVGTAVTYLIIQGPAWAGNMTAAKGASLAGFLISLALFLGYCLYQLLSSRSQEIQRERQILARTEAFASHVLSLADLARIEEEEVTDADKPASALGALVANAAANIDSINGGGEVSTAGGGATRSVSRIGSRRNVVGGDSTAAAGAAATESAYSRALRKIFDRYDTDHSGELNKSEVKAMFKELGFRIEGEELDEVLKRIGGQDRLIQFNEFEEAMGVFIRERSNTQRQTPRSHPHGHHSHHAHSSVRRTASGRVAGAAGGGAATAPLITGDNASEGSDESDDEEEEEEEDEELSRLSPFQIKLRAFSLLLLGVGLVTVFSDPMVSVLSEFANRINVNVFYVSFIVTPLISNASELISSIIFASRKTSKSITLTFSQLLGAATMNNTFCLAIFLALVYFKNLQWKFSAEVTAILVVEVAMVGIAVFQVTPMWRGLLAMSLFPLSLVLVYLMENVAGMD